MADEDPWGAGDEEETPAVASKPASKAGSKAESKAGSKATSKAGSKAATPKGSGAASKAGSVSGSKAGTPSRPATPTSGVGEGEALPEAEVPPQDDPNRPRPLQLYKHWVRYINDDNNICL